MGDDLDPDEITTLLGRSPSFAQLRGEKLVSKHGTERIARRGMWRLCANDRSPGDLDGQIHELLGQLTADLSVWMSLCEKYEMDLFCGLFMNGANEGLAISPTSLEQLGSRGIEMGLDIYRIV
jgi:hypothetical protein